MDVTGPAGSEASDVSVGQAVGFPNDSPYRTPGFVGRRHEISEVRRMLPRTRLLTLTGAGGVGKTSLAREVSEIVRDKYRDGVRLAELARIDDADLLAPAVAAALGIRDTSSDPVALLIEHLADKRMLLVLDNCEHLLDACAHLAHRLLRGTRRLRILATSRQSLGVYGEQVLPVPSLPVPLPGDNTRAIARRDAVRLFAQRAAAIRPGFQVDADNARAVARLAQRLDGIPLAIELAAVRLRGTPVEDLVNELDQRLEMAPEDGPGTTLARHQTLRATMDWSYELCSPGERRLWERLSIFPGGVDLETAEAVCAGQSLAHDDVFDLMAGLVDKSILGAPTEEVIAPGARGVTGPRGREEEWRSGTARYHMLEMIRAYGEERLPAADAAALRERYIDHYHQLILRHRVDRVEPGQIDYYRTLTLELPNVRAALDLCFSPSGDTPGDSDTESRGQPDEGRGGSGTQGHARARPGGSGLGRMEAGLQMVFALWAYWLVAGAVSEGRHWLRRGLGLVTGPSVHRVTGLWADGLLALYQGDPEAGAIIEECLALARRVGDESALGYAMQITGVKALSDGDAETGLALMEEALARQRALGDVHAVGLTLYLAALFAAGLRPDRAAEYGEELVAICEERNATLFRAYGLYVVGMARWEQGDWRQSEAKIHEVASFYSVVDDRWGLLQCLEMLAWTAGAGGRHERAARLLGAAHHLWRAVPSSPSRLQFQARSHEECAERARRALGARPYAAAFRDGTRSGLPRMITYALEGRDD